MKNASILVLALSSIFAVHSNEIKQRNVIVPAGRPEGRITRGKAAGQGQFPYQAFLILTEGEQRFISCGASLISHEWVLTAAHCTLNSIEADVLLGAVDRRYPEVKHVVSKQNIFTHVEYDTKTYENDIALIKIPFTKYSCNIRAVKLPPKRPSYSSYVGESVIASGWGRTSDSPSSSPHILQWAELTIIPNKVCQMSYLISPGNICTSTVGGVNICNGDSGGPIVLKDSEIQIGLTSFGARSCIKDVPSVFIRVSSYLEWIKKISGVSS